MNPALSHLLERVLALPECTGEPAELIRAFLGGDRSERLGDRLRPESRPLKTPGQLAIFWALFAILHVLIPDPEGEADALRGGEAALARAAAKDGPPSLRRPRARDLHDHWDRGRVAGASAPTAPAGAGWYYAVARRYNDHREVIGEPPPAVISTRPSGWYFVGPRFFTDAEAAQDGLVNDLLCVGAPLAARVTTRGPYASEGNAVAALDAERPTDPCPAPAGALEGGA